LVRLGRRSEGLRQLDGGLAEATVVEGVAVGDEETTR
jgi:hypothetical protein